METKEDRVTWELAGPGVEEVLRVMDQMEKAWSDKNLPELFRHYWHDDGFVLFTSRGAYYGWPAGKAMLEKYFADLEEVTLKFGPRKVRRYGDVAAVVYEWRTDARSKLDGSRLLREGYGTETSIGVRFKNVPAEEQRILRAYAQAHGIGIVRTQQ